MRKRDTQLGRSLAVVAVEACSTASLVTRRGQLKQTPRLVA